MKTHGDLSQDACNFMRGINTTGFPPVSMTHKMGIKIPEIKDFNARQWVPPMQLEVWMGNMTGEEGDYFIDKMVELSDIVKRMPLATDQEAESKPHLRYFTGDMTWHIYAKDFPYDGDSDNPNDPGNPKGDQRQAFGHADLGYGGEFGYISLVEMFEVAPSLNLDMHFTPGDARR